MAIPVYSRSFFIVQDATELPEAIGPPPGLLWIIRDIQVYNGNATTLGLDWRLGHIPTLARLVSWFAADSSKSSFQWTGRLVIKYPELIDFDCTSLEGAAGVDVYCGGYELTLP